MDRRESKKLGKEDKILEDWKLNSFGGTAHDISVQKLKIDDLKVTDSKEENKKRN